MEALEKIDPVRPGGPPDEKDYEVIETGAEDGCDDEWSVAHGC